MDNSSNSQGVRDTLSGSPEWGSMGGAAGDGITGVVENSPPPPHSIQVPSTPPPQEQAPTDSTGGGITRFATPEMVQQQQQQQQQQQPGSYADRSAQSYASYNTSSTPQQQALGGGMMMQGSGYGMHSQQQLSAPPGSFAARSQQMHQPHVYGGSPAANYAASPSPQQQNPQTQYAPAPVSYGASSQSAYQQQGNSVTSYGANSGTPTYTSPPQQKQPYLSPARASQSAAPTGSFAARSAYAHQQQQPSQVYTTPQQSARTPYNTPNVYTPTPQQQPAFTGQPGLQQQQQPPNMYSSPAANQQFQSPPNMYSPQQQPGLLSPQPGQPQIQQNVYNPQLQQQQQQLVPPAVNPQFQPPMSQVVSSDNYSTVSSMHSVTHSLMHDPQQALQQLQQRLLTDAIRKVQEHAYYMKQAMEQKNLPVILDRAAHMVGELGGPPHGPHHHHVVSSGNASNGGGTGPANTGNAAKLDPKHYYELYMRVLDEIPAFEEYLLGLAKQAIAPDAIQIVDTSRTTVVRTAPYTMKELYDCTQYCPRVVSRLYLQIAAGSALIRTGEVGAKWVLNDLQQVIRCEQNPIRGLFLRHYLLTALRDKLPDTSAPMAGAPHLETITDDEEADVTLENEVISETDPGTVKDSYQFILDNLKEMNKLWVRIQHLPGEGRNKDVKKRRERERNDLRMIVGTNLVRLSQLECVTSKIYGEYILPQILDHIVVFGDPLSQAYLMDCLVQVFPDEYHIETMPILLGVCPRLRDKVNIRTILQGLMDRLANYLAEEELLDETDTNQVKRALARDSFSLFEECISKVFNSRGPKLTSKEVLRLQSGLLQFSLRCFPGNMEQVAHALGGCVRGLRQANASNDIPDGTLASVPDGKLAMNNLDVLSVLELEKLLSIPLDSLGLKVLQLGPYSDLAAFLPWTNRRQLALSMLDAVTNLGSAPQTIDEIEKLFMMIEPIVVEDASVYGNMGGQDVHHSKESCAVSKLIHLLNQESSDTLFEMLKVAQQHVCKGTTPSSCQPLTALVFASIRLAERVFQIERGIATSTTEQDVPSQQTKLPSDQETDRIQVDDASDTGSPEQISATSESGDSAKGEALQSASANSGSEESTKAVAFQVAPGSVDCREILKFAQETIGMIADLNAETAMKLFMEVSLLADGFLARAGLDITSSNYSFIAYELMSQALTLYEDAITDSKAQHRCIKLMIGTLLASRAFGKDEYERLITKVTQFSAKVLRKNDQCELVSQCAHLFYPADDNKRQSFSNPQRALECLQRALKLADACTTGNPANAFLFVDLLETYIYFFEQENPSISPAYITGLVALVREHTFNSHGDPQAMTGVKSHFLEVVQYINAKKADEASAKFFASVQVESSMA